MTSDSPVNKFLLPILISLKPFNNKILFNLYVLLKINHDTISFDVNFGDRAVVGDTFLEKFLDLLGSDLLRR